MLSAQALARVSPMRWSNGPMGSSPASRESWPGNGSITTGVPKKSRTWGQAGGILVICLRGRGKDLAARQVRRVRRAKIPEPAPEAGRGRSAGTSEALLGTADE